jgi:DNA (cytosine-5)-methyltransferase 1
MVDIKPRIKITVKKLPKISIKTKDENACTKIRLVDLFAGTGAFSYVMHNTDRVTTIFANDILDSSEEIFNLNNPIKLTKNNINDLVVTDIPSHDILTAGFPCQPFSVAGLRNGFDDERSNVFWTMLSIIEYHNPKILILENVKNLQSHDNGKTFKIIKDNIEQLGYHIKYSVLNTCKITSIPQNRERIYIVCFKNIELYEKFNFDFASQKNSPISQFLEDDIPDKYYYGDNSQIFDKLRDSVIKHINTNTTYQYRRYYVRENKSSVCPTLTANMGTGGHNVPIILDNIGTRKLTPRECFNLQGFPKNYKLPNLSDSKLYSLAGNSVSVPVIECIIKKILNLIE